MIEYWILIEYLSNVFFQSFPDWEAFWLFKISLSHVEKEYLYLKSAERLRQGSIQVELVLLILSECLTDCFQKSPCGQMITEANRILFRFNLWDLSGLWNLPPLPLAKVHSKESPRHRQCGDSLNYCCLQLAFSCFHCLSTAWDRSIQRSSITLSKGVQWLEASWSYGRIITIAHTLGSTYVSRYIVVLEDGIAVEVCPPSNCSFRVPSLS